MRTIFTTKHIFSYVEIKTDCSMWNTFTWTLRNDNIVIAIVVVLLHCPEWATRWIGLIMFSKPIILNIRGHSDDINCRTNCRKDLDFFELIVWEKKQISKMDIPYYRQISEINKKKQQQITDVMPRIHSIYGWLACYNAHHGHYATLQTLAILVCCQIYDCTILTWK